MNAKLVKPLVAFLVCLVGTEFKKTRLPSQSA